MEFDKEIANTFKKDIDLLINEIDESITDPAERLMTLLKALGCDNISFKKNNFIVTIQENKDDFKFKTS